MAGKWLKSSEKAPSVPKHLLRRSPRFNLLSRPSQSIPEVNKLNDIQININCLPEEILIAIFQYLAHNDLGYISRVCKRWFKITRYPVLWKKVNVWFHWSHKSQVVVVEKLFQNLPSCVTHLKLFFQNFKWKEPLNFVEFCATLGKKCPSLKVLILHHAEFAIDVQSAIDLSRQYMQNIEILSIHHSAFMNYSIKAEYDDLPKIKILDLYSNYGIEETYKLTFSKMSSLKEMNLFHTGGNTSWFTEDTSVLHNLEVLNICAAYSFDYRFFQTLQNCALKLTELYICHTHVKDNDFSTHSLVLPRLKCICLKGCRGVTCEGIFYLVRSCKSLQNVYVDRNVAKSYKQHPFIAVNESKLLIVKTIDKCRHVKNLDYLYEQ